MHLSLKGSMDRQPLTDRLGDRLLAEYGGAAAAYSLRALNGNGDSVVRVRRASDNDEKDFTASQVSSGELTNWVNSQIVPPLDIGVETSEGRIPVPEGGTSIGIPAAAYSLRNLSTTYTGNVVDVRRSSGGTESFTAAEVADGTLEAWVSEDATQYMQFDGVDDFVQSTTVPDIASSTVTIALEYTANQAQFIELQSAGAFHLVGTLNSTLNGSNDLVVASNNSNTPNNGAIFRYNGLTVGDVITIVLNIDATYQITSATVNGASMTTAGSGDSRQEASSKTTLRFGRRTDTGYAYAGYFTNFSVSTDSTYDWDGTLLGATSKGWTISGFPDTIDGFVTKWYDQSGNDNHATQGTDASQPKIVDGGSLVSGGLDFDGVDDLLVGTHNVTSAYNFFSVTTDEGSATSYIADTGLGFNDGVNYGRTVNSSGNRKLTLNNGGFSIANATGFLVGTELISQSYDGTTINAFVDGSLVGTSVQGYTASGTSLSLGSAGSVGAFLNGKMAEIIIYPTDQSANRTAIEANIGETYGITGIPAYDNTVDGFVETWYDQSGNGNDATQVTIASQPKIVDGGSLVTGGIDFDGVDDRLTCPSLYSSDISMFNVVTTSNTVNTSNYMRIVHLCDGSDSFQLARGGDVDIGKLISKNTAFQSALVAFQHGDINGKNLISAITSSTDTDAYIDGSLQSNASESLGSGNNATTTIGARDDLLSTTFFAGSYAELILYNSDQSSNRVAIETNINDAYQIYQIFPILLP